MGESASNQILNCLNRKQISYKLIEHLPVYTAAEADQYTKGYDFIKAKNLFLHHKHHYYLVVLPDDKRIDMKRLQKQLQSGRLSFASDDSLFEILGITTGAVSPFNLINDRKHQVNLVIDQEIADQDNSMIGCHPNDNTKTVLLSVHDLLKFVKGWGNQVTTLPL